MAAAVLFPLSPAGSSCRCRATAALQRQGGWRSHRRAARQPSLAPATLALLLVLAAVVIAPERPQDQEAICQRHNGAVACRVW